MSQRSSIGGTEPGRVGACVAALLAVNLLIAWPMFRVEYTAYNGSIEGTFITISRILLKYPGQWSWWPFWSGGIPFEDTYLPFTHWLVAAFTWLTGLSVARAFHVVHAMIFCLAPLSLFWMLWKLSRKLTTSVLAAIGYTCVSASALAPTIRNDMFGAWNLRRLYDLVYYGENPHLAALAFLPLAILAFHRALADPAPKWKIVAGIMAAVVVLSNAFGGLMLVLALLCMLLAWTPRAWWKSAATLGGIGLVTWCWISPWLSLNMIRALRKCAPSSGGVIQYTAASWVALGILVGGFLLIWWMLRRRAAPAHLQFLALYAWVPSGFVAAWYGFRIALIPQPGRYEQEVDLLLLPALVFLGGALLERFPQRVRYATVAIVSAALMVQTVHAVVYSRRLVRAADPATLGEYKVAKWLDRNRPGDRAFISGSAAFIYNEFTDNPQLFGGHEQHTVNMFIPIVRFTVFSDMNAGDRGAEFSVFWLKAFGVHQVTVVGPDSNSYWKPFAHPHKFDGVLPLLWHEGDDSIYDVPMRGSLAHVIPAAAVVARTPIHGLDIAPAQPYVAALDDPQYPVPSFHWKSLSEADVHASVKPGQVVSVQVTYDRGWEAWANGKRQSIRGDALGQMIIDTDCRGACDISLRYTGGRERMITRLLSVAAMLSALTYWWLRRESSNKPQHMI